MFLGFEYPGWVFFFDEQQVADMCLKVSLFSA